MPKPTFRAALSAVALLMSGCAHLPPDEPSDPLEPLNRGIYRFNKVADDYVVRPVASGYVRYTPAGIRQGVHNVIDNAFYPTTVVNDVLQGKFAQGGRDFSRFLINTTLGLAGMLDVATPLGFARNDEDLGQTLGHWGVGEGWYLMLPILGPSNGRDLVGRFGDTYTGPTAYVDTYEALGIAGVDALDTRAGLLDKDKYLASQLDPYVFIRTAYLQYRQNLVYDGNPPRRTFNFDDE